MPGSLLLVIATALGFVALGVLLLGVIMAVLASGAGFRRDWVGEVDGHRVVIRNHATQEQLFVDGVLVDQTEGGVRMSAALKARVDGRLLEARLGGLFSVYATLHVDGKPVILEKGPHGDLIGRSEGALALTDGRWGPVRELVEQIATVAPDLAETAFDLRKRVATALQDLARLQKGAAAHGALGGPAPEIEELVQAREAEIGRLVEGLKALHLAALRGGRTSGDLEAVLASVEVEVEAKRPLPQRQLS
ncbi:MAG: hypothetical protein H6734_13210 [Alphaproteobacteria bacterium]|nr:hypothetical protein [Alphaproteobacteria bacterium]